MIPILAKVCEKSTGFFFSPKICPKVGMHKSHLVTNYVVYVNHVVVGHACHLVKQ